MQAVLYLNCFIIIVFLSFAPTLTECVTLVNMGSGCSTSPIQTINIFTPNSQAAIEFQANAASDVTITTVSVCIGGASNTFDTGIQIALFSTAASSPFLPLSQLSFSHTGTTNVPIAYQWRTLTLATPLTVPAGNTRYALVVKGTSSTMKFGSVNTGTVWNWPVFRQASPCSDPCVFRTTTSATAWSVFSANVGFNVGGNVAVSASRSPTPTPSGTASRTGTPTVAYFSYSSSAQIVARISGSSLTTLFGSALATTGSELYVGAPGEDRVYTYTSATGAAGPWLVASGSVPTPGGYAGSRFGASIALSEGNSRLFVGAPGAGSNAGAVFVLSRTGSSPPSWVLVQTLTQGTTAANFGAALSARTSELFASAPAGRAIYRYSMSLSTGMWAFNETLMNPCGYLDSSMGSALAASRSSAILYVGVQTHAGGDRGMALAAVPDEGSWAWGSPWQGGDYNRVGCAAGESVLSRNCSLVK